MGELVEARVQAGRIEVCYVSRKVEKMPGLRGYDEPYVRAAI
jgi:hypothetical protein